MAKRDRKFHCVMEKEDFDKLTWLAEYNCLSRSNIVRQLIWMRYHVSHDQVNMCADGHQCMCPEKRQFPTRFLKEKQEGIREVQEEMNGMVLPSPGDKELGIPDGGV